MSQSGLATAAGMQQPSISAYESGRKRPRPETLERILRAARTRPSIPLATYADEVLRAAARFHLRDVRVFGSAVRGHDTELSDIDLLVGLTPEASLFDLGGFAHEVEELTGFPADVLTDDLTDDDHFRHVLDEAVPL
ncbi:helix-turn-helix domain-containing protein [Curtobacterium caseinilyticum]|uniref:Helix-turn-helix domain-containing protein n=1 Tax=Curtobacterium caseinilyticum TaxID=3055137 RepID=A0ABT7TNH6_9MICO|nr:XRE family transcriptional regulator [Curtobacterium caseinilyticum]MDM7891143.1 helix-turn-helix domain-containing protein [Curtobacterium caseinilyticum]